MLYVQHMHTLVCRVFKWKYEQLLYGQTFLPTDIRFARANAPLKFLEMWVTVSVTGSSTLVSYERVSFAAYTCQIRSLYLLRFKRYGQRNFFFHRVTYRQTNRQTGQQLDAPNSIPVGLFIGGGIKNIQILKVKDLLDNFFFISLQMIRKKL